MNKQFLAKQVFLARAAKEVDPEKWISEQLATKTPSYFITMEAYPTWSERRKHRASAPRELHRRPYRNYDRALSTYFFCVRGSTVPDDEITYDVREAIIALIRRRKPTTKWNEDIIAGNPVLAEYVRDEFAAEARAPLPDALPSVKVVAKRLGPEQAELYRQTLESCEDALDLEEARASGQKRRWTTDQCTNKIRALNDCRLQIY